MAILKLDLTNVEMSQIKYKISKFPDGQQDIVLAPTISNGTYADWNVADGANCGTIKKVGVQICSRFNSFKDLELILCATAALRRLGVEAIDLYTPYMLGARSDMKFNEGGTSYEVDIIAPIINAQNYRQVTVLDPHSTVMAACIKNLNPVSNLGFVESVFESQDWMDNIVIVSPDAGALKKIYNVAEHLTIKGYNTTEIAIGNKHRDIRTGKILSTGISDITNYIKDEYNFVIIDDICDGGRTFIELAKTIRHEALKVAQSIPIGTIPNPRVYLIVTHGIFSAGTEVLKEHFDGIFTTNSYKVLDSIDKASFVQQIKVI